MCGRTSMFAPPEVLEERFDADLEFKLPRRYNIAPTEDLAVITNQDRGAIQPKRWGFIPAWADDTSTSRGLINARAETVDETRSFRDAFADRRCLVLADGFYEWQETRDGKQPYRIALGNDSPFAFAGLWDSTEVDGDTLETCTIITTDANDVVEPIHDRMPVILEERDEEAWITDGGKSVLDPYDEDDLRAYPVSTSVNNPENDAPSILEEIDPGSQSGLDEFGTR